MFEKKFKVWVPDLGIMGKPFSIDWLRAFVGPQDFKEGFLQNTWFDQNAVILQFTGEYDSDGKEIYEKDILEISKTETMYDIHGILPFKTVINSMKDAWSLFASSEAVITYKIIGNVYTHPELYKKLKDNNEL